MTRPTYHKLAAESVLPTPEYLADQYEVQDLLDEKESLGARISKLDARCTLLKTHRDETPLGGTQTLPIRVAEQRRAELLLERGKILEWYRVYKRAVILANAEVHEDDYGKVVKATAFTTAMSMLLVMEDDPHEPVSPERESELSELAASMANVVAKNYRIQRDKGAL